VDRFADVIGLSWTAYRVDVAQRLAAVEPRKAVLIRSLAVREGSLPAMTRQKRHRLERLDRFAQRDGRGEEQRQQCSESIHGCLPRQMLIDKTTTSSAAACRGGATAECLPNGRCGSATGVASRRAGVPPIARSSRCRAGYVIASLPLPSW